LQLLTPEASCNADVCTKFCGCRYYLLPCGSTEPSDVLSAFLPNCHTFNVGTIVLWGGLCYKVINVQQNFDVLCPAYNTDVVEAHTSCGEGGGSPINCSRFCTLGANQTLLATITISGTTEHVATTGCETPCGSFDGIYNIFGSATYISGSGICLSACSGASTLVTATTPLACDCFVAFGVTALTISWCIVDNGDGGAGTSTITVSIDFDPPGAGVGSTLYQNASVPNGTCGPGPITLTRIATGACCDFPATIDISFAVSGASGTCA